VKNFAEIIAAGAAIMQIKARMNRVQITTDSSHAPDLLNPAWSIISFGVE
jgi:ribonuclease HI